jgi:hypothetical protein
MNNFIATGRVFDVQVKETVNKDKYVNFTFSFRVRAGKEKAYLKKYCTLWCFKDQPDFRLPMIVDGAYILLIGTMEAFVSDKVNEETGEKKKMVYEKLIVKEIQSLGEKPKNIGVEYEKAAEKEEEDIPLPF